MNDEMKRLQKEINGKEVVLKADIEGSPNCILIWPPSGKQISIQFYGYTDAEILKFVPHRTIEEINKPDYCLASIQCISVETGEFLKDAFKYIASLPNKGTLDFFKAMDITEEDRGHSPSCPYG